ncbi:MAG: hypothetical protein HOP10_14865 [Chitinophagaceae bacterium]|nr:hypothetical protein [Chitinophagaceae bacterium]
MRQRTSTLVCFLLLSVIVAAQDPSVKDFEAPKKNPKSEKEFKKSEADLLKAVLWLETTPIDTGSLKRTTMNAWVLMWMSDCPYITFSIDANISTVLFDKNADLMMVWLGGIARQCLGNNNAFDPLKANTAGVKAAINCYQLGGQINADEDLDKAIVADKEGKLEDWVKEVMK